MHKAVFIDRDGTINKEVEYLSSPDDLELLPGVVDALKLLFQAGYKLIIITNQAGIARGYFSEGDYRLVEDKLYSVIEENGVKITDTYFCPHHPEHGEKVKCDCRKPSPGMLLQAAKEYDIDLSKSYMIGDKASDVMSGINAGVGKVILVRTGYGVEEADKLSKVDSLITCDDLLAAAKGIVGE